MNNIESSSTTHTASSPWVKPISDHCDQNERDVGVFDIMNCSPKRMRLLDEKIYNPRNFDLVNCLLQQLENSPQQSVHHDDSCDDIIKFDQRQSKIIRNMFDPSFVRLIQPSKVVVVDRKIDFQQICNIVAEKDEEQEDRIWFLRRCLTYDSKLSEIGS